MEAHEQSLAVVMPVYNEARTVRSVVDRVLASPYTAELVVVDDGSTDGTPAQLADLDDPRLSVITHPFNLGKGAAVRRGFAEVSAPYVIIQDADLEYDPDEYATMLGPLVSGHADVVFGSRFAAQPHRVLYFWNAVGNKALTLLSNAITNLSLTDVTTGSKAFRREVVENLVLDQDRFGFELEVTAKVALRGWRVYEVGISYNGRTYGEGRKTRWLDGLKWLYCIARYSPLGMAWARPREMVEKDIAHVEFDEADSELESTLDNLDDASNYADWIVEMVAPFVHGEIVEIGAGHGTMSDRLRALGRVTASEPSNRAAELLAERFADAADVTVVEADTDTVMRGAAYDSAVMINVLEHIPDDLGALRSIHDGLRPGGILAVFVPAHEFLYSDFDFKIGHRRRYRRSTLAQALSRAGFEIVEFRYVNLPGAFAWLVVARLLRRQPTDSTLANLFDRVAVPVLRRAEARYPVPFGLSLLAIARRPLPRDPRDPHELA